MAGNGRIREAREALQDRGRAAASASRTTTPATRAASTKEHAEKVLAKGVERLRELQEKLYAQDRWAVLLIFQAMDAAARTARSST